LANNVTILVNVEFGEYNGTDQSQDSRRYEDTSARDQEIHLARRSEKYI